MSMMYSDPFAALLGLQRALEARQASDWLREATTGTGSFPPINVFQQGEGGFVAIIELPGVSKSDLNIQAKENTIRIAGKKSIQYEEGASVHRRERGAPKLKVDSGTRGRRLVWMRRSKQPSWRFAPSPPRGFRSTKESSVGTQAGRRTRLWVRRKYAARSAPGMAHHRAGPADLVIARRFKLAQL